ncbi:MAG TPA: LptA/OstA family protein [Steroidobacter sp.]|uniref:LptA/OstA family protein n=1 Tax=Steroidobacter sp. TaxID=1978227 RepID=UPI002EDB608F
MESSIRNRSGRPRALAALLSLLFVAQADAAATAPTLDETFVYSADVLSSDFRNDTIDVSGNVRVTQGASSIEAQTAKGRNMSSDTQRWTFEDAVHIRTAEAQLESNLATAAVVNGQIANARVEGSPARFEQISAESNREVRGRAGVIEYDFSTGVVKLTNQVWFSNGKDEFRADVVVYSVRDERVQINPGGSSNRVRGIIRPNQNKVQNTLQKTPGGAAAIIEPTFNERGEAIEGESIGNARAETQLATEGGA